MAFVQVLLFVILIHPGISVNIKNVFENNTDQFLSSVINKIFTKDVSLLIVNDNTSLDLREEYPKLYINFHNYTEQEVAF